jgi:hypothetical protein
VDVRISVAGGNPAVELESLSDWLRGEPPLAGRVRLTGPKPIAGELGSAVDVLTVAVGSGGVLSVLASSLRSWLSQPRRSDLRVRIHHVDGSTVEIDMDRIDTDRLEGLLREALRSVEGK